MGDLLSTKTVRRPAPASASMHLSGAHLRKGHATYGDVRVATRNYRTNENVLATRTEPKTDV